MFFICFEDSGSISLSDTSLVSKINWAANELRIRSAKGRMYRGNKRLTIEELRLVRCCALHNDVVSQDDHNPYHKDWHAAQN